VAGRFLGFVDENERLERRTRPVDGFRKLFSNVYAILGHHRLSEGVPSNIDAILRKPHQGFQRLEAPPVRGLYPSNIPGRLYLRRKRTG